MGSDPTVDVLLAEYAAMRQEIRMLLTGIDSSLRTMVLLMGGLLTVAVTLRDERILYFIPTVIFLLALSQMMRATCANIVGLYCQVIQQKLRETCGTEKIIMNWEGSALWRNIAHPSGVIAIGFIFIFIIVMCIFSYLSYRAFLFWTPSLAIHLLEVSFVIAYAIISMRWNLISTREKWICAMLNTRSNKSLEATSSSTPCVSPSPPQV